MGTVHRLKLERTGWLGRGEGVSIEVQIGQRPFVFQATAGVARFLGHLAWLWLLGILVSLLTAGSFPPLGLSGSNRKIIISWL